MRSDHLPLQKFLRKMTLNNTVNNWSTEIESFNINFVHISGKANVLADTLSRLIDTDPDLQQQPELEGHEFGKYCFETLPKARGSVIEVKLGVKQLKYVKSKSRMTIPKIRNFQLNYHWKTAPLHLYKGMTRKFGIFARK